MKIFSAYKPEYLLQNKTNTGHTQLQIVTPLHVNHREKYRPRHRKSHSALTTSVTSPNNRIKQKRSATKIPPGMKTPWSIHRIAQRESIINARTSETDNIELGVCTFHTAVHRCGHSEVSRSLETAPYRITRRAPGQSIRRDKRCNSPYRYR